MTLAQYVCKRVPGENKRANISRAASKRAQLFDDVNLIAFGLN